MPIIIPANSATSGGFDIANSLRFNRASSDSLSFTPDSTTNRRTFTISFWMKIMKYDIGGSEGGVFNGGTVPNSNGWFNIQQGHTSDGDFMSQFFSGAFRNFKLTQRVMDPSAWYHFVVAMDTTQGTDTNRLKYYVNGTQVTSFSSPIYPDQNFDTKISTNNERQSIGCKTNNSGTLTDFFDGYLSEFIMIDGQQLSPTSFGEFDEDSGIWKPIESVADLTFGNNGYYLEFKKPGTGTDASGMGADTSGNNNHFSVSNLTAVDQSTDTCTNNFATMSTVTWFNGTKANGGLTISTNQTSYRYQPATIGVSSGKWYWEIKLSSLSEFALMGITDAASPINDGTSWILGSGAYDYSVVYNTAGGNGHKYNNAGTGPSNTPGAFMGGFSQGNIMMFALDCDNNTLKIGTNNSWANGSGSTNQTFSNSTAISITAPTLTTGGFYFPAVGDYGGATSVFDFNFGSPPYAISSGNQDGNGYGNFEYAVPSGYLSLNTKNLSEANS